MQTDEQQKETRSLPDSRARLPKQELYRKIRDQVWPGTTRLQATNHFRCCKLVRFASTSAIPTYARTGSCEDWPEWTTNTSENCPNLVPATRTKMRLSVRTTTYPAPSQWTLVNF